MSNVLNPAGRIQQAVEKRLTHTPSLKLIETAQFPIDHHVPFHVTVDFVVHAETTEFWGVFKTYQNPTPETISEILMDLRKLADVAERTRIDSTAKPSSVVLFAILASADNPASDRSREFSAALRQAQEAERLLESVGLSRVFWDESVRKAVDKWGAGELPAQRGDVDRFFAPLLLTARRSIREDVSVDAWQEKLRQAGLNVISSDSTGSSGPADSVQQTARAILRQRLEEHSPAERGVGRLQPRSFNSIKALTGFRRFRQVSRDIKFGSRMTVVYGPNGSGKSSLLSAAALGISGTIMSDMEDGETVPEKVVRHGGAGTDGVLFGTLSLERQENGEAIESDEPIQYRQLAATPPVDTFMMSQTALRRFILKDDTNMFKWFARQLGLDAGVETAIKRLQTELQTSIQNSLTQTAVAPWTAKNENLVGKATEWITSRLNQNPTPPGVSQGIANVRKCLDELTTILGERAPVGDFWTRLEAAEHALVATESADHLAIACVKNPQDMAAAAKRLQVTRATLAQDVAMLVSLVPNDLLAKAEKLAKYRRDPLLPTDDLGDADQLREIMSQARRELSMLSTLLPTLQDANHLPTTAKAVVTRLRTQAEAYERGTVGASDSVVAATSDKLHIQELLNEFEALVEPIVERGPIFEAVHSALATHKQHVETSIDTVQQQINALALSAAELVRYQRDEAELITSVESLFARMVPEVQVPVQPGQSLSTDATVRAVVDLGLHCQALGLNKVRSVPDELLDIMAQFYDGPTKGAPWGGPYTQLYAWDYLQGLARQISTAVEETVKEILTGDFGTAMQEILDTLSGYGWSQPPVKVKVTKTKVSFEAKWGKVSDILNVAEQNLLALAFFFTAYLFVGRRWSKAVFIDDPFQNLDDVNLYGFIRLFDDVARVVGAEQIVIALHQPMLRDYVVTQFANSSETGAGFVLLDVYHTSDQESDVEPHTWGYRLG